MNHETETNKIERPVLGITGASGFVGKALVEHFKDYPLVGLYRSHKPNDLPQVTWRSADLYSLKQTLPALEGVDVAFYLVHSMMPSSRLFQGNFRDTDVIIADNFVRAARSANVKRIVYLGGLSQNHGQSEHLRSRYEVEEVLRTSGIPLTTLRAGIVIGACGSSFDIVLSLVKKLPFMLFPKWMETETETIDISDVVRAFRYCIEDSSTENRSYDLGSGEIISYGELTRLVSKKLGKSPKIIPIPFGSPRLSVLWIRLFTKASKELISPLVESLKTPMTARDTHRLPAFHSLPPKQVDDAIVEAIAGQRLMPSKKSEKFSIASWFRKRTSEVRSVQRLTLPPGRDAEWIAAEYMRWMPKFMGPFIHVKEIQRGVFSFQIAFVNLELLRLEYDEAYSPAGRFLYRITGGALASARHKQVVINPRLEFREIGALKCVIAGIHNYVPSLPWFVYKYSQALIHMWVMKSFDRHLTKLSTIEPSRPT